MVLFENVICGQFVEVKHQDYIVCGTVRYKGYLNGVKGQWVGLELEYPLGKHNGCWRGQSYFKCKSNHGLFIHASNVRFYRKKNRSKANYHKVADNSSADDLLFSHSGANYLNCYSISVNYAQQAKSAFQGLDDIDVLSKEPRYSLSQRIGRTLPAATMLKSYHSQKSYGQYSYPEEDFSPKPVIPHYTMPHEALKRQIARGGWEEYGLHRPRFLTV